MNYKDSFSSNLSSLRQKNHLTLDSLGKILGITNQAVSRLEKGKSSPSVDVLFSIADYFNVSTDWLLGRTDDPTFKPVKLE